MRQTPSTLDLIHYLDQQPGHHQILGIMSGDRATAPYYHTGDDVLTGQVLGDWANQEYDVYLTLNPVAHPVAPKKVKAADITTYSRFMIDIDGNREAAEQIKDNLIVELNAADIAPEWITDTGNGQQIIIRLADLPVTDDTTNAISDFVAHFAEKHDTEEAHLDRGVADPSRLGRLPGSVRYKGGDGRQGSFTLSDTPTFLTLEELNNFKPKNPRPIKVKATSTPTASTNTADLWLGSTTIRQLRDSIDRQNVQTLDAPANYPSSFRLPCPQDRSTSCNLLFTLSGGRLKVSCKHDKCQQLSTFDHLTAYDIDLSRLSPIYTADASPLLVRWMSAVMPQPNNVKHEDGATIITTANSQTVTVWRTYVECDYRKLPASVRARVESQLRAENESLDTVSRLATQVTKSISLVRYNGVMMRYDAERGGYSPIENYKPFVMSRLEAVTAADSDYLREQYGVLMPIQSFGPGPVSAVGLSIMGRTQVKTKYDFAIGANYSNGIWCALTDRLIPHGPQHFVRPALSFEYDDNATAPRFSEVLNEVYPESEQQQLYKEKIGTTHAGDSSHECLLVLVGPGGTGKGVMTSVAKKLVVKVASPGVNDLTDKNGLTSCIGAGMMIINEAPSLKDRQVASLKMITGGDDIQIHRKYESSFNGPLVLNIWLLSNELLTLPDPSGAIMRRLQVLIHQTVKPEAERDASLKRDGLDSELPGIARIARDAYRDFRKRGHFPPNPHVDHLLEAIVEDSSPVKKFIAERCEIGKRDEHSVLRTDLYDAYLVFANELGIDRPTKTQFSYDLKAAAIGIASNSGTSSKNRKWLGISLKPAE